MVEAAIVLPIIILSVALLIRVFVFYIDIIVTQTNLQKEVFNKIDTYDGKMIKNLELDEKVELLKGGLLGINVDKEIIAQAYLYNEDFIVRAGKIVFE